jgi:hypothetical protein
LCAVLLLVAQAVRAGEPQLKGWVETRRLAAPEAVQAAAANDAFVFAIANSVVAKYDRQTGVLVGRSTGDATHLNSGVFIDGRLYCAHSNYPAQPEHSEIKVLDPTEMAVRTFHDFGASEGSLTWAVRHDGAWWCNFAFYGPEKERTYVARLVDWCEVGRWKYPPEVLQAFGQRSASGGIWHEGRLLVTGHDEREAYLLEVPGQGDTLRHVATLAVPFTGQGLASDPRTGGLVGIDRRQRQIVFAERAGE